MAELSARDRRLLDDVAATFAEIDPVPPEVLAAAKASLAWRTVDAELAELVADTAEAPMAGVRSTSAPRLVTFESDATTVEVEVVTVGEQRRLVGQVVPPAAAHVEVRSPGRALSVEADELGRFVADGVAAGPVSLRVTPVDDPGAPVVTSWVAL